MAVTTKTETDTVNVTVKGGSRESFSYQYEVLSGNIEDAMAHANGNGDALAEAYFDALNARSKAGARAKIVNANTDPELKIKQDAIRTMAKAFNWSKERAKEEFEKLAGDPEGD